MFFEVVSMKTAHVTHQQASQLLHNKFVVVLGDSSESKSQVMVEFGDKPGQADS